MSGFSTRLYRRPGEAARFPASFLDALAERLRATRPKGKASLIAIDGWGCGGKTALAEGLLDRLEPVVQYFGMDDFFVGFGHEDAASPVPHLRWGEVREALACLGATGRAAVRTYDWEGARVLPPRDIEGGAWLVEGLYSLRPDLRPHYDFTIWVEGGLERRMDRVAARDGAHVVPLWETDWTPRERAYIQAEAPWRTADLVVAGAELDLSDLGRQLRKHPS